MRVLKKLWYGQYSLAAAFWGFYVGGFMVMLFPIILNWRIVGSQTVSLLLAIAFWCYMFVASVGVWISAGVWMRARREITSSDWRPPWLTKLPGLMARAVVVCWGLRAFYGLLVSYGLLASLTSR